MTADDFRRIALGMEGAVEAAHMGHPDFRVNGRIFATLRSDNRHGMVALTPDQQQTFMKDYPAGFSPEAGAWGRQGCTAVRLEVVDDDALGEALTLAWQKGAAKGAPARRTVKREQPAAKAVRRRKPVRRDR